MRQRERAISFGTEPQGGLARFLFRIRQLLWGFFLYELWHDLRQQRRRYEDAMNIIIVGEFIGLPLMNSTLTLRLLPYLLPDLQSWKERQLQEPEVLDHPPEVH